MRALISVVCGAPFALVGAALVELEPTAFALGASAARALGVAGERAQPGEGLLVNAVPAAGEPTLPVVTAAPRLSGAPRRVMPTPVTHHVSAERVLAIAGAGLRPSGVPVDPDGAGPAGIVVGGVSALGIGAQDGDVLTHVDGVPVGAPGEVVALVLGARARRAPAMTARLRRGALRYDVVVEMPYEDAMARASASSVASPEYAPR